MKCNRALQRRFVTRSSTLFFLLFIWSSVQAELILTAPPRETANKGAKDYGPLAKHLTNILGEKVTYQHPDTWIRYQRDMRADKYDIIFDGPHFMSWRIKKLGHTPVAKLPGKLGFVMITKNDDAGIKKLLDLANEKICAISPPNLSTLTMIAAFAEGDAEPSKLKAVKGGMKGVYKAFKGGECRAAILRDKFYETKLTVKDKAATKVVFKSKLVANQGITVSKRVDKEKREKIIAALLEKNPGTFPIFRRFMPGEHAMLSTGTDEYKEYYKLLQDIIVGW